VNAAKEDAAGAVLDATTGGADVVIEASGSPQGLESAWSSVRRGGRVLLVGLQDAPREVDLFRLSLGEVDIGTTLAHVCDTDLPEALQILARQDLRPVIDRVVPLDRVVSDGIEPLAAGAVSGKILVSLR
jgi:(R,R)-butanediol dehydrogenase / meso-butanediol dehydrogenase / diacetyl reductase